MFELILSAIGLGIMLSLVFIGPIFFLLIETSFSRGPKHALALDLGVIVADILCITAAFFASADLIQLIDKHPGFYRITSFIILIYAVYMEDSKTRMHLAGEEKMIGQNYFKTFLNGFFFNILNIGVVLFCFVILISFRYFYPKLDEFLLYMALVVGTYLAIDFFKIYLAKQFHYKLTERLANQIRKGVGFILVGFSIFIFLQSFKKFNQFDRQLKEADTNEQKLRP